MCCCWFCCCWFCCCFCFCCCCCCCCCFLYASESDPRAYYVSQTVGCCDNIEAQCTTMRFSDHSANLLCLLFSSLAHSRASAAIRDCGCFFRTLPHTCSANHAQVTEIQSGWSPHFQCSVGWQNRGSSDSIEMLAGAGTLAVTFAFFSRNAHSHCWLCISREKSAVKPSSRAAALVRLSSACIHWSEDISLVAFCRRLCAYAYRT